MISSRAVRAAGSLSRLLAPDKESSEAMDNATNLPRVLIVDDSRMVRAMIIKRIREHYDFREEVDGEAGWQALVLDHSIHLVISDLSMPILDGYGLLTRIRESKLARIRDMPVVIISGEESEEALERAKALGVSDFISKSIGGAELLARIDSLVKLSLTQNQLKENREQQVQDPDTGLFTRKYIELQAAQAMSHAMRHDSQVSAMVMGFDRFPALREEHGAEVMQQLQMRFSKMLSNKMRKEDSLGHFAGSQFAVISPGTPYPACESFANRLREAIAVANISLHGQRLSLSVSVGVANTPEDRVTSAGALLELAGTRLKTAQQSGGNRVIACSAKPLAELVTPGIGQAIDLINGGHESTVIPHLLKLGKQVLPLLRLLERELKLGLPLADIEKSMLDRAQEVEDAGQE
jgi:diguanylate cyclase (GGDEF)-like protein